MYPISNAVKALFESEQRQVLRITGTDKNGAAINITDADVVIDSFNIDRFSCIGNKLEIGTATSAQMTVKLDNYDGRFNGIVFEGTELFVEIGIADWTQSNPTVNWIPCGYFTPDEQPRSLKIITIHALDRMMQFDATMPTLTPWVTQSGDVMTDSQGNIIYFVSNVQFPVTVQNLVKRVALLCGVPFTQSLSNLPNYSYTLSALPTLQQEITFRNLIQWCAGIMGANAWIDWTGSLRFSWYGATTGYTSTTANRFSSDLNEDNITITGVQYTNTQNVTIVSGTADYTIDLTGNYLAATGIAEILPNIKNVVNGFTYRPFTASVINAPYLWPMDIITFNKDGTNYTSAVTNVNFGINGATALESKGETAQTNSGTAPSGVTKDTARMIEGATEAAAEKAVDSMTQEQIFNKLTNNGEVQGLLLYNDKVYLNAEYISTGFLSADRLAANSIAVAKLTGLVSGGLNNSWVLNLTDGTFTIGNISANNVTTGTLNADRIAANSIAVTKLTGSISSTATGGTTAWTIDLTNGTLTIGDINADNIKAGTINGNNVNIINLNASNIVSGTLNANLLRAGTITDTSGLNYWILDGENSNFVTRRGTIGSFTLSNGALTYGSMEVGGTGAYVGSGGIYYNETLGSGNTAKLNMHAQGLDMYYNGIRKIRLIINDLGFLISTYGSDGTLSHPFQIQDAGLTKRIDARFDVYCSKALSVSGTKSRVVNTDQYSDRLLYCYETPSPMFGDVGEGTIGEDGKCYVWIDPVFAQTITTTQYQVFLQRYGSGECWVSERKGSYFVVDGTPGMAFGWEIKAKQRDFDQRRLDRNDEPFTVPTQTYGEDAAKHIQDIMKERISA